MPIPSHLDHVALLVRSVDQAAERCRTVGHLNEREDWPGEGTAEIYVGAADETSRLLLMEPIKEGAYSRAMAKRGPGLHHVGLCVENIEAYSTSLAGSGWYLMPRSLESVRTLKTAWFARPGTAVLIEVHERAFPKQRRLIQSLELPPAVCTPALIQALNCPAVVPSTSSTLGLTVGGNLHDLRLIFG